MSHLAGVFYFDQRAIPEGLIPDLIGSVDPIHSDALEQFRAPGLFMLRATVWFDRLTADSEPRRLPSGHKIAFDGRLDNREDLILRLRTQPHLSDSDLASAAFDAWGVEGLAHLIGDWSCAIWEPQTRTVLLASDHAVTRPLYYHASSDRVLWSSSLKDLAALARVSQLDDQFVAGFLMGCGTPGRTPWRGILAVRSGQAMSFGERGAIGRQLWNLPVNSSIRYHDERHYDEHLRWLFRESVRARMRTTYPMCSELSGGLDSSSIVCMASHLIESRQAIAPKLISLSFGPPRAPDEKFYRTVQRFCGIDSVLLNTDDFPFLDTAHLDEAWPTGWGPLFGEVSRRVKQCGARVYLSGQGGDLLMGNWIDDSARIADWLRRGRPKRAIDEALAWSKATRVPVPALLRRALSGRYDSQPNRAIPERYGNSLTAQFQAGTGIKDPDWIWPADWKKAPLERRRHFRSVSRVLESGMFRPPERLQHLYYTFPYAHRPLLEFLLAIPADVLCRPGEPRTLMRRAFRELLPPDVVRRRSKASFTGEFLKTVRPVARVLLADPRPMRLEEMGFVEGRDVRARLQRITHSLPCNEPQLRQIVLLELWLRKRDETGVSEEAPASAAAW